MASEASEHVIVDFANSNTSNNNTFTSSTRFRCDKVQKLETLIVRCLASYKAKMESSNKDLRKTKFGSMSKSGKEWARVIKFWCFFRWVKNSKGFKIKAKQGWKFLDLGWNFPYNNYKISALPRPEILAQGRNLPCNKSLRM